MIELIIIGLLSNICFCVSLISINMRLDRLEGEQNDGQ